MNCQQRGLTLLETLLASAILAMLAGACIPMLSAASRSIASNNAAVTNEAQQLRFELANLADKFMRDPQKFGCKDLRKEIQQGELSVHWPDDSERTADPEAGTMVGVGSGAGAAIVVRALPSAIEDNDHLWLVFTSDAQSVVRYLDLPMESPPK